MLEAIPTNKVRPLFIECSIAEKIRSARQPYFFFLVTAFFAVAFAFLAGAFLTSATFTAFFAAAFLVALG